MLQVTLDNPQNTRTFMIQTNTLKITCLALLAYLSVQPETQGAQTPFFPVNNGLQLGLSAAYIDTADSTQVVQSNGIVYVQDWKDTGGAGGHATQTTLGRQPIYLANAVNGQPALQFDGLLVYLTTTLPQISGDKSIFIVEKRTTTQFGTEIASTTSGSGTFLGDSWGGGAETKGRLSVAQDLQLPAAIGKFVLKSYIRSGTTETLRLNDAYTTAQITDGASGNYVISDPANYHFAGQIAEILIYNRAVSDRERQSIEAYLNDKYALKSLPPPVAAGLQLRLAADAIDPTDSAQVVKQNGSMYVKDWLDTSGNSLHATQGNSALQPLYIPSAINARPVLQFNGKGAFLATTLPQIAGDKTIFIVHKRVGTQLRTEISSTAGNSGMFLSNAYNQPLETEGRLDIAQDLQLPALLNSFVIKSYTRSGTTGTLTVNDSTTSAQIPDVASGNYTISDPNRFFFSGQIAEVLIYNRALSDAERQSIENYLSEKYALWDVSLRTRPGLRVWLSADTVNPDTTYQPQEVRSANGSNYVSSWFDRSPYASDASQTLSAAQPLFVPNALNGKPVLRFDGVGNYLTTNFPQINGNKSIFVVHKRVSKQIGEEVSFTGANAGHLLGEHWGNEVKGTSYNVPDLQLPWKLNQFIIKSFIRNGSNEILRVNSSSVSSGTIQDVANGNYSISDRVWPFGGDIAEVLIFARAMTDPERTSIEDYLQDKWSYWPNDIHSVAVDLRVPPDTAAVAAPGVTVKQTSPEYAGTSVYHTLYLPTDWQPGRLYPVIVEYAPNGGYTDVNGITTTGNLEDNSLGYGLSGGQGYIVIGMPTIGGSPLANQTIWWGDVSLTKDYCLKTLRHVCENYGGDPASVILSGFSRGAAACNYIGLNDDTISDAWLAFIPHSGYDYDGEYGAAYAGGEPAAYRLQRLKGRLQHISQGSRMQGSFEVSLKYFLIATGVDLAPFSFRNLPFVNHTGDWALRPIQLRRDTRSWLQQVVANHTGTHAIRGVVTTSGGTPIPNARIQSGYTHFTFTDGNGNYVLAGLIDSTRTVSVTTGSYAFSTQTVSITGADANNVNFTATP